MRWYSIGLFLVLVFGLADAFALIFYLGDWVDFAQASATVTGLLAFVTLLPAVCAILARTIARDAENDFALWPLPGLPAAAGVVMMPAVFALVYIVLALAGWETPQWNFRVLLNQLAAEGQPAPELPGAAPILLVVGILGSMALGTSIYTLIALGQEYAWRGFLLPRLLPLGRPTAYLLTTAAWLAWWTPLAAVWVLSEPRAEGYTSEILRFAALIALLSLMLCAVADRYRNTGLAALWLGAFMGQLWGIWEYLFPGSQPPWTEVHGIFGLVVWALVCAGTLLFFRLVPARSEG